MKTSLENDKLTDTANPFATSDDPLAQPVDEQVVLDLHAAGLLDTTALAAAMNALRRPQHWWRWANRSLLFLGAALVLAGVMFFFAYNWARMHPVAKFCFIETGLWICAIGALRTGLEKISGKVLLLSASVLVGILLAVYGQVYQTGADAYENFVIWAALILLWVIIARFAALWILWLAITNVALILFWVQVDAPDEFDFYYGIFVLLGIWNGLALVAREYGAARGLDWLSEIWTRHMIWVTILCYLTIPTIGLIISGEIGHGELVGAIGMAGAIGGQIYFHRYSPDVPALGFGILTFCGVLLTLIGRVLFDISEGAIAFLAFGVMVLGISSAAAFYLRYVARIMGDDGNH